MGNKEIKLQSRQSNVPLYSQLDALVLIWLSPLWNDIEEMTVFQRWLPDYGGECQWSKLRLQIISRDYTGFQRVQNVILGIRYPTT